MEVVKVQHGCIYSWGIRARQKTTNLHGKATRRSPVSIRARHLQSSLMLRAAAVSPHNHLDKLSEETGLGNTGMRGEQREVNVGDDDSLKCQPN